MRSLKSLALALLVVLVVLGGAYTWAAVALDEPTETGVSEYFRSPSVSEAP